MDAAQLEFLSMSHPLLSSLFIALFSFSSFTYATDLILDPSNPLEDYVNSVEPDEDFDWFDFVDQTFDISMSKNDILGDYSSDYIFTLRASHNLSTDWRVFGSIATDGFTDFGVGYSFLVRDTIYNEVSFSAGSNFDNTDLYTSGLFTAFQLKDLIVFTNFDVQYIDKSGSLPFGDHKNYRSEAINLNKLVGVNYPVHPMLEIAVSYGHDKNHYSKLSFPSSTFYPNFNDDADQYLNLGGTLNLFGIKPFISHRFDLNDPHLNSWDFSLSFDF
jgi:hypothetical protein